MVRRGWGNEGWKPGHPDLSGDILQEILFRFEGCATTAPGPLPPVVVIVQIHKPKFEIVFSNCPSEIIKQLKPTGLCVETRGAGKTSEPVNRCTIRG